MISRKAIDEKPIVGIPGSLHCAVDEAAGDFHGDDRAILDMCLDKLAVLRPGLDAFLPQQIAGRQVGITVMLDDVATQGTLAGAWTAQDEHHLWFPSCRDSGHRANTTSRTGHERPQLIHAQSHAHTSRSIGLPPPPCGDRPGAIFKRH